MRSMVTKLGVVVGMLLAASSLGFSQQQCSARCPDGSMSEPFDCNSNYVAQCLRRTAPPPSQPQRTAPAPPPGQAEAHRLNQKGIDAYISGNYESAEKYFQEALDKLPDDPTIEQNLQKTKDQIAAKEEQAKAKFNQDKQEALGQLKGISNTGDFDSGLKGASSTESGLKGAPDSAGCGGLKDVITDPMVVDARCVPTGLPPSVEAEIPHTPAGDRVRKGFEAILDHDWIDAHAWFQDALNHDPGNAGIQRLIDLAEYTMERAKHPRALVPPPRAAVTSASVKTALAALDKRMDHQTNADLAKALDDFNRNYLTKHLALLKPIEPSASAPIIKPATGGSTPEAQSADDSANWKAFFDAIFAPPP